MARFSTVASTKACKSIDRESTQLRAQGWTKHHKWQLTQEPFHIDSRLRRYLPDHRGGCNTVWQLKTGISLSCWAVWTSAL